MWTLSRLRFGDDPYTHPAWLHVHQMISYESRHRLNAFKVKLIGIITIILVAQSRRLCPHSLPWTWRARLGSLPRCKEPLLHQSQIMRTLEGFGLAPCESQMETSPRYLGSAHLPQRRTRSTKKTTSILQILDILMTT